MNEFNIEVHTNNNIWIMTLECRSCGATKVTKNYNHFPSEEEINREIDVVEIEHKVCTLVVH